MRTSAPSKEIETDPHHTFSSLIPRPQPAAGLATVPWNRPPLVAAAPNGHVSVTPPGAAGVGDVDVAAFVHDVTEFGATASDGSTSGDGGSDSESNASGSECDPSEYEHQYEGLFAEPLTPSLLAAPEPLARGCTFDEACRMLLEPVAVEQPAPAAAVDAGPEPLVW